MKRILVMITVLSAVLPLTAQVKGRVLQSPDSQPVIQAAVQLLSVRDSSQVVGGVTDVDGNFMLPAAPGAYIFRASYIGMVPRTVDVQVVGETDLGNIVMAQDAMWLEQSVVTAAAPLMKSVADTVIYNPAAILLADDAMLDDLLSRIPGIELDGRGNVSLNGRRITQLYVNGKRYFGVNVASGLKNLPAEMIENIRAYERQSDYARLSGIEDGESEPVLDIRIKPAFLDGWNDRVNLGYGTSSRYNARFNGNRITDDSQSTVIASATNISNPNPYNAGSNQLGNGSSGEKTAVEAGANLTKSTSSSDLGGNVFYDYNRRDVLSHSESENIYAASANHGRNDGRNLSGKHSLTANGNFEWRPAKTWNIVFKPQLSYSRNDNSIQSVFDNFDSDSCSVADRINHGESSSHTIQDRLNAGVSLQYHRKIGDKGRSATVRGSLDYSLAKDNILTDNQTRYYSIKSNPDSLRVLGYDQSIATRSLTSNTYLTWNEPLAKGMSLQFTYRFQYRLYTTDKDSFTTIGQTLWDPSQSAEARYDLFTHYLQINYRYFKKKFKLTAGVVLVPQHSRLTYPENHRGDTSVFVFSAAPNLSLRYNKSRSESLLFSWNSFSSQPRIDYMLNVPSSTNPLYVRSGNPGLKPSFTHNFNLSYNFSSKKYQNSLVVNVLGKIVQRSVSLSTAYDPLSGVRTVRPENIDGNWRTDASVAYTQNFAQTGFSLSANTLCNFVNTNSYLYNNKRKEDDVNRINRLMAIEKFNVTYRNSWVEVTFNSSGQYTLERSLLRPGMNQQPWAVMVGGSLMLKAPWKMSLSSDISNWFQRGYAIDDFNRDFLLWNARLTQSCLKGKLNFSVSWKDILRQQENLVRSFSADRRSIVTYNGVGSYLLFSLTWKFRS